MKKLLLIFLLIGSISCSKNKERCYECKDTVSNTYFDAGCYTGKEWEEIQMTDQYGQLLDKDRDCRRR